MSLFVTDTAAHRIQTFLQQNPDAKGFKINIKKTGCSGWGYDVELPTTLASGDMVFTHKGINLIANKETMELIAGTTIDYQQQGINHTFVYKNPKSTGECGCGESFTTN
ncbi:MAG: iron-sulfur cluster assembly accessory protein [Proteobacteria bacterium]|nr:iron-sulfur cluster assembly accessory protein [Pseudomonadota bacterium]